MNLSGEKIRENIATLSQYIYGNWMQQITYVFAEVGIADELVKGPLTYNDLAETLQLHPPYLKRYLRCAAELGYIQFDSNNQTYSITELGAFLSSNHPYSQNAEARLNGADYRYGPWGNLSEILKNGHSEKYSPTLKDGTLSYLEDKPEQRDVFHKAMFHKWKPENEEIIDGFDFSMFHTVMDIGCGTGSFLKAMIESYEHLQGIMFDLPTTLKEVEVDHSRIQLVEGSFLEAVPDTADIYTMKNVIHNWPLEETQKLLKNTHHAMTSTKGISTPIAEKRLLIIENVLPEEGQPDISNWMDMNFMIIVDGMERTLEEYRELGEECGFDLVKLHPTKSNRSIIEFKLS